MPFLYIHLNACTSTYINFNKELLFQTIRCVAFLYNAYCLSIRFYTKEGTNCKLYPNKVSEAYN